MEKIALMFILIIIEVIINALLTPKQFRQADLNSACGLKLEI